MTSELQLARRQALESLLPVVAGCAPLTGVEAYLCPDLVVHMDGIPFRGLAGWRKWIRYQRACSGMQAVELRIDTITADDDLWRVTLEARGQRDGRRVRSGLVQVTYRWDGIRIAEAWTRRANYRFFFPSIRSWPGFAWLLLCILFWNWLHSEAETVATVDG